MHVLATVAMSPAHADAIDNGSTIFWKLEVVSSRDERPDEGIYSIGEGGGKQTQGNQARLGVQSKPL